MHQTPPHTGKTGVRGQITEVHCDGVQLAVVRKSGKVGDQEVGREKLVKFEDKVKLYHQGPATR